MDGMLQLSPIMAKLIVQIKMHWSRN